MNLTFPSIDPVPDGVRRPFWSVMIPTYNCADTLRLTLRSVLAQDAGEDDMQIEVVDDGSTRDDPEAVVREMGDGRVAFFRQSANVGAQANFTTCIRRARGRYVHILHGDDFVFPGFYKRYREAIDRHECGMVVGQSVIVDERERPLGLSPPIGGDAGVIPDAGYLLAQENVLACPSVVVSRAAYERVGGFNESLVHAADWEMWVRVASRYPTCVVGAPLCAYRWHSKSDTSKLVLRGENVKDMLRAIDVITGHIADDGKRRRVEVSGRVFAARGSGWYVLRLAARRQWRPMLIHLGWIARHGLWIAMHAHWRDVVAAAPAALMRRSRHKLPSAMRTGIQ